MSTIKKKQHKLVYLPWNHLQQKGKQLEGEARRIADNCINKVKEIKILLFFFLTRHGPRANLIARNTFLKCSVCWGTWTTTVKDAFRVPDNGEKLVRAKRAENFWLLQQGIKT